MHTRVYSINFQVWRPLPHQGNFYSLEGEAVYSPAILDRDGQAILPGNNISVQLGDVVGYIVTHEDNERGGIQLDTDAHDTIVYYASLDQTEGRNQLQINSSFSSSTAAPILSINVCK